MLVGLLSFLPFFCTILLPGTSPETYAVSAIPANLTQEADVVIRLYETRFEVKNSSEALEKVTCVYTILNKNAAEEARLFVPYSNFEKVNYIKGTLFNKYGQEIQKLKTKEIYDLGGLGSDLIEDSRVKIANLQSTEFPFTVAYEYELSHSGSLFYPTWQPQEKQHYAVEQATFQMVVPKKNSFRFKSMNGAPEPAVTTEGNNTTYLWKVANLTASEKQIYQPPLADITPIVYTAPNEFSVENVSGNMSTWAGFGNWISQLNAGRTTLPEKTIAEVKKLVANEPDDLAKIKKLYAFLQNKTRYVSVQLGIGGWQPFEAAYVDAKGYGDCKALTNYMYALLKAAGINSHYTLIRAGKNEADILKDFPSNQFNHVLLCVPTAKDTIWLECTDQTGSWGYNGNFTGNRHGLMITPEGGKIVRTTVYGPERNLLTRKATVQLDQQGNATANIQTVYTGLQQDELRQVMANGPETQRKWLNNEISLPNFSLSDFNFQAQDGLTPEVKEILNLKVVKYANQSGKRYFLTLNFNNRLQTPALKKTERKFPIVLNLPFIDSDEVTYSLPNGVLQAEHLPEPIELKSVFGEYQASCKMTGDKITYTRRLKMNSGRFPASSYAELAEFLKKVSQADKSQVVLISNT